MTPEEAKAYERRMGLNQATTEVVAEEVAPK